MPRQKRSVETEEIDPMSEEFIKKLDGSDMEYLIGIPILLGNEIGYTKREKEGFVIGFENQNIAISFKKCLNAAIIYSLGLPVAANNNCSMVEGRIIGREEDLVAVLWSGTKAPIYGTYDEFLPLIKDPYLNAMVSKAYGETAYQGIVEARQIVRGELRYRIQFEDGDHDTIPFSEMLLDLVVPPEELVTVSFEDLDDESICTNRRLLLSMTPSSPSHTNLSASNHRKRARPRKISDKVSSSPSATESVAAATCATTSSSVEDPTSAITDISAATVGKLLPPPFKPPPIDDQGNVVLIAKPPGSITTAKFWGQSLKMALQPLDERVVVGSFTRAQDGGMGEVEASRFVAAGDTIHAINYKTVYGMSFEEVVEELLTCQRPVVISFRSAFPYEVDELRDFLSSEASKGVDVSPIPTSKLRKSLQTDSTSSSSVVPVDTSHHLGDLHHSLLAPPPILEARNAPCVKQIVRVSKPGLNLQLRFFNGYVYVDSFTRGSDKQPGEVEESGRVQVGDTLVEINGASLCNLRDIETAVTLIKTSPRPVYVVFERIPHGSVPGTNPVSGTHSLFNGVHAYDELGTRHVSKKARLMHFKSE